MFYKLFINTQFSCLLDHSGYLQINYDIHTGPLHLRASEKTRQPVFNGGPNYIEHESD